VLRLHLEVALVGAGNRIRGEAIDLVVVIHEKGHA
jgi:hypothetical protein